MIFEATLNNVKVTRDIPTDWPQVKYSSFLKLQDRKELSALSTFTGFEPEVLKQATVKNLDQVIRALSFVKTNPDLFKLPKKILGYEVRQDLGFEPFGRYTDIKELVEKEQSEVELLKQYPLLCATYCMPGVYDFKEAEKLATQFEEAPCTEVLALGNFLLLRLIGLKNSTEKTSLLTRILPKKVRLAFQLWRARLGFQLRYFIFNRFHHITKNRS
jgi:hypothetical protein